MEEVSDSEMNGKELMVKYAVVFFFFFISRVEGEVTKEVGL